MKSEIKTVTITKDTYDDLIELASDSLKKVVAEEYDVEFLLKCMAVASMIEADFGEYNNGHISRKEFNLLMGVDDGSTDE